MARSLEEITQDIDELAASLPSGQGRRLAQLSAELRGEELPQTPNEQRAAEAAKVQAAEAEQAAAPVTPTAAGVPAPPEPQP